MATIKSYSDLEQSKKLAEILPIESADMWYIPHSINGKTVYKLTLDCSLTRDIKPAWSLAKLMDILPDIIKNSNKTSDWYWFNLNKNPYQISYGNRLGSSGEWHDMISSPQRENLVDACVEMVLILKENELI